MTQSFESKRAVAASEVDSQPFNPSGLDRQIFNPSLLKHHEGCMHDSCSPP